MKRGINVWLAAVFVMAVVGLSSCGSQKDAATFRKVPGVPAGIDVKVDERGLLVSWQPVSGATQYNVFWGLEKGEYKGMMSSKDCSLFLRALAKGELYNVAVTALNQTGESDYSKEQVVVYDDEPGNAKRHLARGNELMRYGSFNESFAYLNAAIRLGANNAEAFKSRGMLYEKMNLPELARKDFTMADVIMRKKRISLRP